MKSLYDPHDRAEIERRLGTLRPESPGRWGRMSPHQAVCHLSDAFRASLGDRPQPHRPMDLKRRLMRFGAFTLPIPWPKGAPTSPGVDAEKGGTPPGEFQADVAELVALIDRFVRADGRYPEHHVWGAMSRGMWGRYGYRHVEHHLRQFGV